MKWTQMRSSGPFGRNSSLCEYYKDRPLPTRFSLYTFCFSGRYALAFPQKVFGLTGHGVYCSTTRRSRRHGVSGSSS